MKIAPLKVSDPWFGRIVNDAEVHADSLQAVPIESTVEVEMVELLHAGPEGNYRPYLHLRGELTEARPAVELPYGVTQLALRRGAGLPVDAFYDFNQQQLSDLVSKGYFSEAFKVPEQMSGIPWALPGKADFLVVAPALSDEPPLVFMSVHDQNSLELDEANSGYELTEYFADHSAEAEVGPEQETTTAPVQHSEHVLDVFSGVDFDLHRPAATVAPHHADVDPDLRAIVPDGVFSRLVSEIQAQQPVEPSPAVQEEPEEGAIVPGSAEDVYLSRVSPGVEQVLAGEHLEEDEEVENESQPTVAAPSLEDDEDEPETASLPLTPDGFLDLAEPAPELAPLSLQFGETSQDDHRKAAERRANRLRAELQADEATAGDEAHPEL